MTEHEQLGLGVGYLESEFRVLGVPYEGRGVHADDAIRVGWAARRGPGFMLHEPGPFPNGNGQWQHQHRALGRPEPLLRGISEADQEITDLYEIPDLTARWDYDRDSLAADLGLARDDPGMAEAADTYLAGARQEFWLEAARLARRRLHPGPDQRAGGDPAGRAHPGPGPGAAKTQAEDEDDAEVEGADLRQDITDRDNGLSRLLSERCSTCILRSGDKMYLSPEQTAAFVRQALAEGTYVVCHLH